MKKWSFIFLVLIGLMFLSMYLLIPSKITVEGYRTVGTPIEAVNRILLNREAVAKWWPGTIENDSVYNYKGTKYSIPERVLLNLPITNKSESLSSQITSSPIKDDSCGIQWTYNTISTDYNPINRIHHFFKARNLKIQLDTILNSLCAYISTTKNIYGYTITEGRVKDSSLLSTKKIFTHYPSTAEVYQVIDGLKSYISKNGGIEKEYPMLNITTIAPQQYEVMIAIPMLRDIPSNNVYVIKKMILGKLLETTVTGGPTAIANGEIALKNYLIDFHRTSPAIPFQMLVTNRMQVSDTTKWVTYVKYPVF